MKDINQNNLKHIKFRDWDLYVDYETTKNTYDNIIHESCDCDDCRNYELSKDIVYPDEIRKLFLDLGIDFKKECEAFCINICENDWQNYIGWFHLKGYFKGPDCANDVKGIDLKQITDTFKIGFRYEFYETLFIDKNDLVQIEFETIIPWNLTNKQKIIDNFSYFIKQKLKQISNLYKVK